MYWNLVSSSRTPPPIHGCNGPGGAHPLVLVIISGPDTLEAFQDHPMISGYPGIPDVNADKLPLIKVEYVVAPSCDEYSLSPHPLIPYPHSW